MTDPIIRRIPQCDRCLNNTRDPHILCTIHPLGTPVGMKSCPDYEADLTLPPGEWWEPEGASYYGNELVVTPVQRLTLQQKLELLDWHPIFTGRCPNCEIPIQQTDPPRIHWDCEHCQWVDDSV